MVSLLPSLTETVCELQCHRLVGVDRYSNFPAAVQKLPQLGGGMDPSIEAVVAARPDLVLVAASSRAAERLEALGLKVLVLEPKTHADVQRVLRKVAQALDVPTTEADKVWRHIDAAVSAAAQSLPAASRNVRVYFEVNRAYGAGASSFIGQTLARLGVQNILGPELGPFPKINPEFVVRANPDVIMVGARNFSGMTDRPGWKRIRAIQTDRLCVFSLTSRTCWCGLFAHGRSGPADGGLPCPPRWQGVSPTPVSTVRPDTGARRAWWLGGALVLLTGVLALASLAVGSTGMEPIVQVGSQLAQLVAQMGVAVPDNAFAGGDVGEQAISAQILWDIRAPAPWARFWPGLCWAWPGRWRRGCFRNPLADPFLLGSASGATLGVASALSLLGTLNIKTALNSAAAFKTPSCLRRESKLFVFVFTSLPRLTSISKKAARAHRLVESCFQNCCDRPC